MKMNGEMEMLVETRAIHIIKQWVLAAVKLEFEVVAPAHIADFTLRGNSSMVTAIPRPRYAQIIIVPD